MLSDLYDVLVEFVRSESAARRDAHLRHIRRPIEERVEDERCLADLRCTGESDPERRAFHFEAAGRLGNTSRFREGDRLRLHRGEYDCGTDVILVRETATGVELRAESGRAGLAGVLGSDGAGWVLDEGFFDSEKMLLAGLEGAIGSAAGRERVLALFAGQAQEELGFSLADGSDAEAYAREAGLNESQCDALALATSATHCHLVQGPPGTGKTHVLARTVATLVGRGERVLVSAFTHRAIHHALRSVCSAVRDPGRVAKIGVYVHDPSLAPVQQFDSWSRCPLRRVTGGYVVGATPFAAASRRMADVAFDTVLIDEASQMTVPLAVLPMLKGTKFVFFGDHRQLPPVLQSVPKRDAASWSVFGSLARHSELTTLNTTYRLNRGLAQWPSENFYGGELVPADAVAGRVTPYPNRAPTHPALASPGAVVFLELEHSGCRTASGLEADAVCALVEDAVAAGLEAGAIGVVTPFRRQAQRVKERLRRSTALRDAPIGEVVVDTVERFQGQERELVVISVATSDHAFLDMVGDFFFQEERWNVAVTRARSKLVIVASSGFLRFVPSDESLAGAAEIVGDLLRGAERVRWPPDREGAGKVRSTPGDDRPGGTR